MSALRNPRSRWKAGVAAIVAGILAFAIAPSVAYAQTKDLRLSTDEAPVGDSLSVSSKCELKDGEKLATITVWLGDEPSDDTWTTTTTTGDWSLDIKVPETDESELAVNAKCDITEGGSHTYNPETVTVLDEGESPKPSETTTKPTSESPVATEAESTTSAPCGESSDDGSSETAEPVATTSPTDDGDNNGGDGDSPCSQSSQPATSTEPSSTATEPSETTSVEPSDSVSDSPCTASSDSATEPAETVEPSESTTKAPCTQTTDTSPSESASASASTSTTAADGPTAAVTTAAGESEIGTITRNRCVISIPVVTTGDDDTKYTLEVWDDHVVQATYTWSGAVTKVLKYTITKPAGTEAAGIGFSLSVDDMAIDSVDGFTYAASVANACSADVAVSIDLPDYTGSTTPGAKQTVTGTGYLPGETVSLVFGGVSVGTVTVGSDGTFSTTFTVPVVTSSGDFALVATGQTSGRSASASVTVVNGSSVTTGAALADTGAGMSAGLVALGVVLAIGGAVLLRRRRA